MSFSSLYLLPVIAAAIVLEGSLVKFKGNLQYRSRRVRNRIRARIIFFRALVIALLLATVITKVWPLGDISLLAQGMSVTLALMLPVVIFLLSRRHLARRDKSRPDEMNVRDQPAASEQGTAAPKSRQALPSDQPDTVQEPLPAAVTQDKPIPSTASSSSESSATGHNSRPATATNLLLRETEEVEADVLDQTLCLDQTLSISEQMESLDNLVNFHDIGDRTGSTEMAGSAEHTEKSIPLEKTIAAARQSILEQSSAQQPAHENLPARSSTELAEMVVRLRSDKMKLQKLVIAQKAVIDAEKQAHERTRVVVKDAVSVMRHARRGQRIAEKIARRERAERQRLENDLDKLKKQMNNALSTIMHDRNTESEEI